MYLVVGVEERDVLCITTLLLSGEVAVSWTENGQVQASRDAHRGPTGGIFS